MAVDEQCHSPLPHSRSMLTCNIVSIQRRGWGQHDSTLILGGRGQGLHVLLLLDVQAPLGMKWQYLFHPPTGKEVFVIFWWVPYHIGCGRNPLCVEWELASLRAPWASLGAILGPSWGHLGAVLEPLGSPWGRMGSHWGQEGPDWANGGDCNMCY